MKIVTLEITQWHETFQTRLDWHNESNPIRSIFGAISHTKYRNNMVFLVIWQTNVSFINRSHYIWKIWWNSSGMWIILFIKEIGVIQLCKLIFRHTSSGWSLSRKTCSLWRARRLWTRPFLSCLGSGHLLLFKGRVQDFDLEGQCFYITINSVRKKPHAQINLVSKSMKQLLLRSDVDIRYI